MLFKREVEGLRWKGELERGRWKGELGGEVVGGKRWEREA